MHRLYRLSARRKFVDNRHIEVTVQSHGQSTRYGSSRHNQYVRRINVLAPQFSTLRHTETMLLVYHHQSERREINSIFYHGVSSYQNLHIACEQVFQNSFTTLAFHVARKQLYTHIHARQKSADSFIMLVSQNFGRSHHARLITIVERYQHGHKRHKCLAATHIALQQTVHLSSATHVATHLLNDTLLRTRQLKRKILRIKCIKYLANVLKRQSAELVAAFLGITQYIKLHIKQLFKFKAILRLTKQFGILRKMYII